MRVAGIAELVYHLDNGVHRGIIADCVIRALNIIIYSAGNTDTRDSRLGQIRRASECSVAADCDNAAHIVLLADFLCLFDVFPFLELGAASRINCRTAALNYIGNASHVEVNKLVVKQTVIASHYSQNLKSLEDCGSCDRSYRSVHSGAVAAACQDSDFLLHD